MSFTFEFDPPTPPKPARPARERDVYTVSRLNKEVRLLLESGLPLLWLEGELSNFAAPASGLSTAWFYGVGVFFSLASAPVLLHQLYTQLVGREAHQLERVDGAHAENAASGL